MFITRGRGGYTRGGQQFASGEFLIVAGGHTYIDGKMTKLPLRAAVRFVRMQQLGNFMMALTTIGSMKRISLSGAYGGDGLPMDAEEVPYGLMLQLPPELEAEFWAGGGHNSAGEEAPKMREWALANYKELRLAGRKKR